MTQRKRLDAFLAEQAADRRCRAPRRRKSSTVAATARSPSAARGCGPSVVVGADGVNGITTRSLGMKQGYRYGVALEGNVRLRADQRTRFRGRAVLELGVVPGGYGWVFAKGDHVNVGVGGWDSEGPRLRAHLAKLCARARDPAGRRRGDSWLPPAAPPAGRTRSSKAGVMLAGDAAGLVDPLSGDGMYEAFVSARLASGAALDLLAGRADLSRPTREPERGAPSNASASWAAKRALDRFPRIVYGFARMPVVWRFADALLRGELASPGDGARHHEGAAQDRQGSR